MVNASPTNLGVAARRILRCAAGLGLAVLLSACGTRGLYVTDQNAPSASARGVMRIGQDKRGGIEVDVTSYRAEGRQAVTVNDYLSPIMGQTVPAPNTLSHTVSANRLHVAYNRIVVNNPTWDVEWFAGMGYERLGWSATVANGGVPTLTGRTAGFGATGGALARWKLSDRWAIDAKVRVTGGGPVSGSRIEAAASYLLTDGLRARLGYARTETEGKLRSSEAYRLIVRTNGPVAALELTF